MYDKAKSRDTVIQILTSPTKIVEKDSVPASDAAFTYENGILHITFQKEKPEDKANTRINID